MPIRRVFLGLDQPALHSAAKWLFDTRSGADLADFTLTTLVVPGGRAGRMLLDLLLTEAESRGAALLPPKIVTAGSLSEELYEPQRPLADHLTQQLAWCAALQSLRPQELAPLIPHPPEPDDLEGWLPLADMLKRLHGELAADALSFADVAERAGRVAGFNERPRWQVLERLQRIYLDTIDAAGLWDEQTARLVAIDHHECRAPGDIVLLGTVDINQALRKMLDQVADHVTALVFAPQDWADRFDEHGCLLPPAWHGLHLPISEPQIRPADDPVDQADAVARVISEYGGRYRGDELIIGVPDEKIVPQITRQLTQCGLPARWGPGRPLTESAPYRLLAAVAEYVTQQRFHPFAALVRHSDVEQYLAICGVGEDYLIQLDEYYCKHLPARLGEKWLGKESDHDHAKAAYLAVARLLEPLAGAARRPDQWTEPLLEVLREVYRGREFNRENVHDAMTQKSLEAIRAGAMGLRSVPHTIAPKVSAAVAIGWVLSQAAGDALPPPPDAAAIELLGWLELPWDDSPALIVTSFNEGFVPEPAGADPFLPNRLCADLGLWDNARRYARDAYYLTVLCSTRRELTLIIGRRDAEGAPLAPSRLLFAAPAEVAARRALRLFAEPADREDRPPLPGMLQAGRQRSGFQIQRPRVAEVVRLQAANNARVPEASGVPGASGAPPQPSSVSHQDEQKSWGDAPGTLVAEVVRLQAANNAGVPEASGVPGASGAPPQTTSLTNEGHPTSWGDAPGTQSDLLLPGQSMRVTEFRDYLACPYRYYLRHILKLEGMSDDATELDGGAFGGLLHDVLAALKEPELAGELDAEKIEAFLHDNLRRELRIRYGKQGLAPLEIQFAQLRHRLSALAKWQAGWAAQGWRVTHTEIDADPATALLLVDGDHVRLRGRIDRIDINERSGEIAVLDYKSSGTVGKPGQTHRRGDGAWIDLQLPLYRHLLQGLNLRGSIRLGYIAVPNDVTAVGVLLADWDETALVEADEAARNVVRNIRQHIFWPPRDPGLNVPPDFAAICLEGVFDAQREEENETGDDCHKVG